MIDTLCSEPTDLIETTGWRMAPRRHVEPTRNQLHVVNEQIFRSVLVRERKRADRFDQHFLLLLVSVDRDSSAGTSTSWHAVVEALAEVKRDTDVLGWFEGRSVIGLIVPEVSASCSTMSQGLESRVRRELDTRLGPDDRQRVSLRLHAHPEVKTAADVAVAPVDPLLSSPPREEQEPVRDALKRALDIIGSVALLLLLLPVLLVVAALVKLTSPGPVFFRQERIGQMAKPVHDAQVPDDARERRPRDSSAVRQLSSSSRAPDSRTRAEPVFKIVNDPRITPIGHFLRKTSLDELPQFWNVLRGEMSLVGPRPPLAVRGRAVQALALPPRARGQAGHHRAVAGDRAQPDDVRRHGAPRPPLRQDAARSGPTSRSCSRRRAPSSRARAPADRPAEVARATAPSSPRSSHARERHCPLNEFDLHRSGREARQGRQAREVHQPVRLRRSATRRRSAPSSRFRRTRRVGRRCKISSHTFICEGVTIEDHVFIGHGVTFINDSYPRATTPTGELQTAGGLEGRADAGQEGRVDRLRRHDSLERRHRRARHRRRRQRGHSRRADRRHRGRQSGASAAIDRQRDRELPNDRQ